MQIAPALARLNSQLPLKARQQQLPPALLGMHRQVLMSLATRGRPPTEAELRQASGLTDVYAALQSLAREDLVVLDERSGLPLGAYPVTVETTPHRISINGHHIYAMCALDAVSVAPLFRAAVRIDSVCHVSQSPITIYMRGGDILRPESVQNVIVGIRWQIPTAVAAHSMCLQMIFLKDQATALSWQAGDTRNTSLFTLTEAVQFGSAFFLPLLN